MFKKIVITLFFCTMVLISFAQLTQVYTQSDKLFHQGKELFNQRKWSASYRDFEEYLKNAEPTQAGMIQEAEYYLASNAYELRQKNAYDLLLVYLEKHPYTPYMDRTQLMLGMLEYENKNYTKALTYFRAINETHLIERDKVDYLFSRGYANLETNNIQKALDIFKTLKSMNSAYQAAARYYTGYSEYRLGNYDAALPDLLAVEKNPEFEDIAPYYIAQIYYSKQDFTEMEKRVDLLIRKFPDKQPIPSTLDWDTWLSAIPYHDYNNDFHLGQWRCWYDFGMGTLGDWGAHIIDTAHEFLELGLPEEINPTRLDGYNQYFYPMSSTIEFKFPKRKKMPPVTITWYDGVNNIPEVPAGYGVSELDPNIPQVAGSTIQPAKLNPGKEIYSKELTFKGGSHGSTLSIIPKEKAKEMERKLPEVPKSPSNHFANFLLSCLGKEKTRSPFSISGPLSQVFCLGVLAQQTNRKLLFDRNTKQITNDPFANALLVGVPPRKEWLEFYKL